MQIFGLIAEVICGTSACLLFGSCSSDCSSHLASTGPLNNLCQLAIWDLAGAYKVFSGHLEPSIAGIKNTSAEGSDFIRLEVAGSCCWLRAMCLAIAQVQVETKSEGYLSLRPTHRRKRPRSLPISSSLKDTTPEVFRTSCFERLQRSPSPREEAVRAHIRLE